MIISKLMLSSINILKKYGVKTFIIKSVKKLRLPIEFNQKFLWKAGFNSENDFWDRWFKTKGLRWPDEYEHRLNPERPLQQRPSDLINNLNCDEVYILDVGAGPLTVLGKKHPDKKINIIAVDPLADKYDRLLEKYSITPIVTTQKLDAEELTSNFSEETFDLVFASNSIDHTYDAEKAVLEMIEVTKRNHYVLLEHGINEAENENYSGFHQWNFSASNEGDFVISTKSHSINMTTKYSHIAKFECEIINNGRTIITRILKHKDPINSVADFQTF